MERHDLTFGFAGAYLTNIQLYLKRRGYPNEIVFKRGMKNSIDKKIKTSDHQTAILAFDWHYIAIHYDSASEMFTMYNVFTNANTIKNDSVDKWMASHNKPLCLITF